MGARRDRGGRRDTATPAAIDQLFEGDADPAAPAPDAAPAASAPSDGNDGDGRAGDAPTIDLTRED